jgi:hypothetical protein
MAMQTVYPLKYPVTLKFQQADGTTREETISNVSLRRPTGKEMKLTDIYGNRRIHMMHAMIAALSGIDEDVVDRMDAEDLVALYDKVGDFLPDIPETGEIS